MIPMPILLLLLAVITAAGLTVFAFSGVGATGPGLAIAAPIFLIGSLLVRGLRK